MIRDIFTGIAVALAGGSFAGYLWTATERRRRARDYRSKPDSQGTLLIVEPCGCSHSVTRTDELLCPPHRQRREREQQDARVIAAAEQQLRRQP